VYILTFDSNGGFEKESGLFRWCKAGFPEPALLYRHSPLSFPELFAGSLFKPGDKLNF
jgi:hypothetical protein